MSALGIWHLQVQGDLAFRQNALSVLHRLHAERADGPTKEALARLHEALAQAVWTPPNEV